MDFAIKSWREMGIRTDNLRLSLIPYSILGVILLVGLLLIYTMFGVGLTFWHQLYPSFAVLVFLSTLQEVFFRGYLMLLLKRFSRRFWVVVLIDAALFATMHLVFPHREIFVPAAFLAGIGFAGVYYYYPNLLLASLVHIALDWSVIPFCHFKLLSC